VEYRLGRQLAVTQKALQAAFDARLQEAGGSISTWVVLEHALEDGQLSQRLLARRISIEGPTLVRHLDRLEAEGLVERRRDESDRRVVRVVVTTAGKELHDRLRRVADGMDSEIGALLSEQELKTMRRVLDRLHGWVTSLEVEEVRA
jgi:MarR family transcriptional regulator for hemolysin